MLGTLVGVVASLLLGAGGDARHDAPQAKVTVFAGSLEEDGSCDGKGEAARFKEPWGIAIDGDGVLYVADHWNMTVRRIQRDGTVETYAGEPEDGGHRGGTGREARFNEPTSIAVDAEGNVYLAIYADGTIRKIDRRQYVTTLVGEFRDLRHVDGPRGTARLARPEAIATDPRGGLWVVDECMVKKVDRSGAVQTIIGEPACADTYGPDGARVEGRGRAVRLRYPGDIAVDEKGNLFISDWDAIVTVTASGVARVVARGERGFSTIVVGLNGELFVTSKYDLLRVRRSGGVVRVATLPALAAGMAFDRRSRDLFVTAGDAILRVQLPR